MSTFALVLARILGFVFRAPGISHPSVPPILRVGFALALATLVSGLLKARYHESEALFLVAVVGEFCIGGAIGFGAAILYDAAYAAGRTIDDYVGIRVMAPNAAEFMSSGFGRLWSLVFTGGFFMLGAYRLVLTAIVTSFRTIAPGTVVGAHSLRSFALHIPTAVLHAAIMIAAPSIALAFSVQIALAGLSRIIPRLATFSLSFPLAFAAALSGTMLAVVVFYGASAHPWILRLGR